jgi:hypothetical protein
MEKTAKGEEVLSWNSLLPIQQRFKSIPGGSLLFVPDNTSPPAHYHYKETSTRQIPELPSAAYSIEDYDARLTAYVFLFALVLVEITDDPLRYYTVSNKNQYE